MSIDKDINELSVETVTALFAIQKASDIKTMQYLDHFSDDGIACVTGLINNIRITFWWCGAELIGALEYGESNEKAKKKVLDTLHNELNTQLLCVFDRSDEEILEGINKNKETYQAILDYIHTSKKAKHIREHLLEWKDDLSAFWDFDTYKLIV